MNREQEVAFAAGIFDGEGSTATYIGSGSDRKGLVFAASVWQSDYRLLNWMKEHFEGGVYGRNGAGYGKNSRKICGEWRVTGSKAYSFLQIVRPFLIVKGENVDAMLKVWESRGDRQVLEATIASRKLLTKPSQEAQA